MKLKTRVTPKPVVSEDSLSSSESSESESDSSSSSDEASTNQEGDVEMIDASVSPAGKSDKRERVVYSRSPSPVPASIPSFLPTKPDGSVDTENERQLKDRFRKFWMQSVADAFQEDLVQIHKVWCRVPELKILAHSSTPTQEPGMNKSRLAMLVDSLASGADAFTSNSFSETRGVNEMDAVMGNLAH